MCWERLTPLLVFMLGQTWMLHWFTGLGYLVLHTNNLATLPDFWCSFSMISHMWRTDTHSAPSSFSLPKLSRLEKCQTKTPSAQSILVWYPCTEGKMQHLLYISAAHQLPSCSYYRLLGLWAHQCSLSGVSLALDAAHVLFSSLITCCLCLKSATV